MRPVCAVGPVAHSCCLSIRAVELISLVPQYTLALADIL